MISASKEFKEKLKSGANMVNYADVTLSDGTVLNLTYKDFMIGGCSIDDKTTDGKFGVGYVIGKTLSIKIANHDEKFSRYNFYNSIIIPYVAMLMDDGRVEKIRKGKFYTMVPQSPGDVIEISAVDGMYLLDKDYSGSSTAYPATLQTIISDACLDCGIPIGFHQFDNMNFVVNEKPENTTYRQVMSFAAQVAGYNARIDNNGYMQLVWYDTDLLDGYIYNGGTFKTYPHDTVIDGGNFTDYSTGTIISGGNFADKDPEHVFRIKSLDVHTDDAQITGVRVIGDDNTEALFGEEGYVIEIKGNPFVIGKEKEVANYLGKRMVGMVFRPFTAQILNNPLHEPFEVVKISDQKGNVYYSVINSISYTIGAYTQIACEAEDPVRNGSTYYSQAAAAVVEARRNTEKQISTYDKAVQNMNQLAANAMGLYRASEEQSDGGYIYYQSNKPITVDEDGKCHFEAGSVVYKSAAEGFFVSTDGGISYTAGFDAQGNAVVNVLAAIGITFDWARGGTLTLGGDNNVYGNLSVLDGNRNEIGKWNNKGISIKGSNVYGNYETNFTDIANLNYYVNGELFYLQSPSISPGSQTLDGFALATGTKKLILGTINKETGSSYHSYYVIFDELGDYGERHGFYGKARFDDGILWYNNAFVTAGTTTVNGNVTDGTYIAGSLGVTGDFACSGAKSRIVQTDDFGIVSMNALESTEPYFSDIGSGTVGENGTITIFFDPVFVETIDENSEYQVFLTRTSLLKTEWVEKYTGYFIVHGESGATFDWMLTCKQKDYSATRIQNVTIDYIENDEGSEVNV